MSPLVPSSVHGLGFEWCEKWERLPDGPKPARHHKHRAQEMRWTGAGDRAEVERGRDLQNLPLQSQSPGQTGPCNLENALLRERSQTPQDKYCVIPRGWNI